jgi:ERF superfamily protein
MTDKKDATAREPEVVAPATSLARLSIDDPQALIRQAIESNASVETLERLFNLAKEIDAERARRAWYAAIAAFAGDCPRITKGREASIATRSGGSYSYTYAALQDLADAITRPLSKHGLSYRFVTRYEPGAALANCLVSHELGHTEESGFVSMPVLKVPDSGAGANPMQLTGIAMTYAKRYALLAVLGLAPADEDDPDGAAAAATTPKVPRPQRSSASRPAPAQAPSSSSSSSPDGPASPPPAAGSAESQEQSGQVYTGKVLRSKIAKTGHGKDGDWTLYVIDAEQGVNFVTFDKGVADFATAAIGKYPVRIEWVTSSRGSMLVERIDKAS